MPMRHPVTLKIHKKSSIPGTFWKTHQIYSLIVSSHIILTTTQLQSFSEDLVA